ncbi:putative lipoate--protein ligase KNAG_0E02710 [Huiozyma naganishii CBS 8797]|uniref:Putative lipoate-protein ligase A n=1 Tax=Huiozyma naganishii (strain ATCC MYA-139 / BCRC 22969 / CBS 8797 / KCTC 17520 / NBRC 10181 / NCYC 3082 / Yp74L-3) TaxID=1071383 RepID=J7R6Q7_HUIN7|nr:hypothetical protein KNAG_0E02710 [Kazachstania naganishii CBS 8797]CCK70530.1 hypothetical protein KNAG_0E02710 [Kazachstania naganishii CBS 8797]
MTAVAKTCLNAYGVAGTVLKRSPLLPNICYPQLKRRVSSKTPFDINDSDDKYKELNDYYRDLFTNDNVNTTLGATSKINIKTEIDLLNDELANLTDTAVPPHKLPLRSEDLQRVVETPGRFVIKSRSNDPYFNLALEHYIFKNTPLFEQSIFSSQRLLFYVNNKCAVIGKNQTIWQELYLNELNKRGYEVLRRLSGGGAVIHDLGNVNYSFLTSREEFRTTFFNQLIVQWLNKQGHIQDFELNGRGDILYKKMKCGGSAFKIARGKSYHHGTMLVNSDIDSFHGLLKPSGQKGVRWVSPSVDSVRAGVTNIPLGSTEQFIDICTDGFQKYFKSADSIPVYYCNDTVSTNSEIEKTRALLRSDKWKYCSGPKFKVELDSSHDVIEVEKGIVVSSTIPNIKGMDFQRLIDTGSNEAQLQCLKPLM